MKKSKRIVSLLLSVLMMAMMFTGSVSVNAAPTSGSCGTNATYTLDTATGLLTISGTGEIVDHAFKDRQDITEVVINEGITVIGEWAFEGCSVDKVTMADSVTKTLNSAFYRSKVSTVIFGKGFTDLASGTFWACPNLKNLALPDSLESIGFMAFCDCVNLESVTITNKNCVIVDDKSMRTIPATTKINCYHGSNAEEYALKTGRTVSPMFCADGAHTIVTDPAVEPTYTAVGKTEGSHCSLCEKVFVAQNDIPMLPMPVITLDKDELYYTAEYQVPNVTLTQGDVVIPSSEYTVKYYHMEGDTWNEILPGEYFCYNDFKVVVYDNPGGNYELPDGLEKPYYVVKNWTAQNGVEFDMPELVWTNQNFVATAKDGYLLSTQDSFGSSEYWTKTVTWDYEGTNVDELYVRNIDTHEISYCVEICIKIDKTLPVISGVNDNVTYVTSQKVVVEDTNLDSVVCKNITTDFTKVLPITDGKCEFTIDGNAAAKYIITAKDKGGNEVVVNVNTDTIDNANKDFANITLDNVKTSDKDDLTLNKQALEIVRGLANNSASENAKLDEMIAKDTALLEKIAEIELKLDDETIKAVDNKTPENVKLEDKQTLLDAKASLDDLKTNYYDNLTDDQKLELETKLKNVNNMISSVEAVENTIKAIEDIPANIKADDVKSVDIIRVAKANYDKLNEYQISLIDKADVDKLNDALAAIDYKIVEISNSAEFTKSVDKDLVIVVNAAAEKFQVLLVDGKEIDKANYTVVSGSTIITVKAEYLNTLSDGEHSFTVKYADDECEGKFTVKAAPVAEADEKSPNTGSDIDFAMASSVIFMLGLSLSLIKLVNSKKKTNK